MRLRKQLNINNTYRVLNLNFFNPDKHNIILVNDLNETKVKQSLKEKQSDAIYLIDQEKSSDLLLNHEVYQNGKDGHIIYYTKTTIPIDVFLDIGTNYKSTYFYNIQDFSQSTVANINKASNVSTTAIYVPHIHSGFDPLALIFQLNDVRFIANQVYLDFDKDVGIKEKEYIFDYLHEILARWTLQLYIRYYTEKEHQQLYTDIISKYN